MLRPTPEPAGYCTPDVAGEGQDRARCPNPARSRSEATANPGCSDLGALPRARPPFACRVVAAAAPLAAAPRDASMTDSTSSGDSCSKPSRTSGSTPRKSWTCDTPFEQAFWQVVRWRRGRCFWWAHFDTRAEGLEAAGLSE